MVGATDGVVILASEAAAQRRLHHLRGEGARAIHATRVGACNPSAVYERLSDPILVRRAKDGDRRALDALCARHAARAERIALHVLRRPEDAADAAQESLVKLVQRIGSYRGQSQFTTWFHRLVVNTCKDVAQARWQSERRTEQLVEDDREARTATRLARSWPARHGESSAGAWPTCRRRRRPSSR